MAKLRRLTFQEATKLHGKRIGSNKLRLLKKEDMEDMEDKYFVAVNTGGDATIQVDGGSIYVGPFDSPEAAQAAVGTDAEVVDSDADLAVAPPGDDETPASPAESARNGKRRDRMETIRRQVIQDILKEAGVDVDTTVKSGKEVDDAGSGNLDTGTLAGKVNQSPSDAGTQKDAKDLGKDKPNLDGTDDTTKPKVSGTEYTLDANGGQKNVESNARSISKGNFIKVTKRGDPGAQVDRGLVDMVENGVVTVQGVAYKDTEYDFLKLA